MTIELPKLPYEYNALEPFIDELTMTVHHTKHHQAYVDKLKAALEGHEDLKGTELNTILKNINKIPDEIRKAVQNNGGGHSNHSLYWEIMKPGGGGEPKGALKDAINNTFSDFKSFQDKFAGVAISQFGSGWGWLVLNNNKLEIMSTPNQDSPFMQNKYPLMGIDVWEHAYYLKYQNRRPEYIEAWWNVVNWPEIEERFEKIK